MTYYTMRDLTRDYGASRADAVRFLRLDALCDKATRYVSERPWSQRRVGRQLLFRLRRSQVENLIFPSLD